MIVVLITWSTLAAIRAAISIITIAFCKTRGIDYAITMSAIQTGGCTGWIAHVIVIGILVSRITDTTAIAAVFVGACAWVRITGVVGASNTICCPMVATGAVFTVVALITQVTSANNDSG